MRRPLILWTIGFVALAGAFFVTIGILNGGAYSAHGFVAGYLDALARHDAKTALAMPGVTVAKGASTALLTDGSLGKISNITLSRDATNARGVHTVSFRYTLGGTEATTDFTVKPAGSFLGLFSAWQFSKSPIATVAVTVLHDTRFTANGTTVVSPAKSADAASFPVFAPGLYAFNHSSRFLTAGTVSVPVTDPGSVSPVQVNVQPSAAFAAQVSKELHTYLDGCAKQKVLLPTACPFGKTFDNRVDSTPKWSMKTYPKVTIVPDKTDGKWLVPDTDAAAHLTVKVQSLFDGSISTFNQNVPFEVSYSIAVSPTDELTITALYD